MCQNSQDVAKYEFTAWKLENQARLDAPEGSEGLCTLLSAWLAATWKAGQGRQKSKKGWPLYAKKHDDVISCTARRKKIYKKP